MCGIFGYVGKNGNGGNIVLSGINRILYRGYDSIGVALLFDDRVNVYKKANISIEGLKNIIGKEINKKCFIAIAHNRWATTGEISDVNAHPHADFNNDFFVVHNGIVENFHDLKKIYDFDNKVEVKSKTDTELIAHIISKEYSGDLEKALINTMNKLHGGNAVLVMSKKHPDKLMAATIGSSLCVCKNKEGVMIASDALAFGVKNSSDNLKYISLEDGELVIADKNSFYVKKEKRIIQKAELSVEKIDHEEDLCEYDFFMKKEIFEQPMVIENVISGRMLPEKGIAKLGGIEEIASKLSNTKMFHFIGCGSAYHACCYGKLLFNRFGIHSQAWIASEFCSNHPVYDPNDVFIFISQSGETADTIEVLNEMKNIKRKLCLGIVNRQATTIDRNTDAGIHIRAGVERGVASTKAFTAQLVNVALLAVFLARQRNMTQDTGKNILNELKSLPSKIELVLSQSEYIAQLAKKYYQFHNYYFLGKYFNSIVAKEGALKLKEISYIHAESYPLGEMKHGPLALICEDFCCVVIVPNDSVYQESIININEILARKGKVIVITTLNTDEITGVNEIIKIPPTLEYLQPIIATIPTQLFAYYSALELDCDADKPRNLAKSVTTK